MWIWIVALFLLILAWGGGFLLQALDVTVPLWLQLSLTAAAVLLVVGVVLMRRWRARMRAKALEREILRQSEQQAANSRPERRQEILALQRQIAQGIDALKRTKLGAKYGRGALYVLPWYAIIGPPGAGKTTAIKHSGLSFPFSDPRGGGAVKGVGGTRNCDWWFTNDAILLDTAGRYATQDDDRDEWFSFLDLLKRYRPRKPLNGLLVAVAVSDLVQASEEQIFDYGTKLRSRIDEIMTRLQMVLPVYLVFTKVDLVAGFTEFWNDLRRSERDQVFGATFPLEAGASTDLAEFFGREFDRLVSVLHARSVRVLIDERRPTARARIFQFPLEFRALKSNLEELVKVLFQQNSFQESPVCRGFYFTSGTQEGKPIDRVISGMARAFGLRAAQSEEVATEPKSYFVTDLFRKVIFPDQHYAGATESAIRRYQATRLAIGGALAALGLLVAIPAIAAYNKNHALVSSGRELAAAASKVRWDTSAPTPEQTANLDALKGLVEQLDKWHTQGAPLSYRWGMYSGEALYPSVRDSWANDLNSLAIRKSHEETKKDLEALVATKTLPPDSFRIYYEKLKLLLMMAQPPRSPRWDVEWTTATLVSQWSKLRAPSEELQKAAVPHVEYYFDLTERGELKPWPVGEALVTQAQEILNREPETDRLYQILVRDANRDVKPIRREDIFYGSISGFVTSKSNPEVIVGGAYTKEGWKRIKRILGSQRSRLTDEGWVLGQEQQKAASEIDKQIAGLKFRYFQEFKDAWAKFITDIEIQKPDSALVALGELQALSEPVWPYQRLLRSLNENVMLDLQPDEETSLAGSILDKAAAKAKAKAKAAIDKKLGPDAGVPLQDANAREVSDVEKAFRPMLTFAQGEKAGADSAPTGLVQYQQILAKLVGVLTDLRDADPDPDTRPIASEYQQAFRAASALLSSQDGFTRPLLSPLLMRPITGSWAGVVSDSGGAAGGVWEVSVWEKWHNTLEDRYPFKDSSKDASIDDFTEFFKPDSGLLWAFYEQNLTGSLRKKGDSFEVTRRFQASPSFTDEFLGNCLPRGAKITAAAFEPKAEKASIGFDINLHSVSPDVAEVRLEIDGAEKVYKNTPEEWLSTSWPAKEPKSRGAKARVKGYSGLDEQIIREGDFGFFRLMDGADSLENGTAGGRPDGLPTIVATWKLRSQGAFFKLDIRPLRSTSRAAFEGTSQRNRRTALFHDYKCPRIIASVAK